MDTSWPPTILGSDALPAATATGKLTLLLETDPCRVRGLTGEYSIGK
jgi:hypothetical protein